MPAGCIFALLPKDKEDAELGKISIMHSVNFKKNPEQLYGIFTTPENIQRVKSWLNESEMDSNLVYTFEGFIETFREKNIVNEDKVEQSFLFDENDAKEVAMESGQNGRKIGQIVNLQSKIKNAIMQIKTNIKETDEKKIGGNIDDREIGD